MNLTNANKTGYLPRVVMPYLDAKDIDLEFESVSSLPEDNYNRIVYIKKEVAKYLGVEPEYFLRDQEFVEWRYLSMHFIHKLTNLNKNEVARLFHKDHSTLIHSEKYIQNYLETSADFRKKFNDLKNNLY